MLTLGRTDSTNGLLVFDWEVAGMAQRTGFLYRRVYAPFVTRAREPYPPVSNAPVRRRKQRLSVPAAIIHFSGHLLQSFFPADKGHRPCGRRRPHAGNIREFRSVISRSVPR